MVRISLSNLYADCQNLTLRLYRQLARQWYRISNHIQRIKQNLQRLLSITPTNLFEAEQRNKWFLHIFFVGVVVFSMNTQVSAHNVAIDNVFDLGVMYYYGDGVQQDYAKALSYFEQAAADGDVDAINNLGLMYDEGLGVEQSDTKARQYFEQAANKGDASSLYNLGLMYMDGQGVDQNYTKAFTYYEQAAEKGNTDALNNLGFMHYYGYGVEQDNAKALRFTTIGAIEIKPIG